MDEITLLALISEGENEKVDFKRELILSTAEDKGRFIKDVIALANSAPEIGYLIIGVDDSKHLVGIDRLKEEQIQEISYTYIEPAVKLYCSLVGISSPLPILLGVIEIQKSTRPHKVAREIGRLTKNEVFIRRGSVNSKAGPDEIIEMHRADKNRNEVQALLSVAKTHLKAENYNGAISAYSKAIDERPAYDLFLARGEAYALALEQKKKSLVTRSEFSLPEDERIAYWKATKSLTNKALEDFKSAVRLANSTETEKIAKRKLFDFGCSANASTYPWEEVEEDFEWLQENFDGKELGEIICAYIEAWDLDSSSASWRWEIGAEAAYLMDEAIQLGCKESRAYYLRARGHLLAGNYGMAVKDLDTALANIDKKDIQQIVHMLCYKAEALTAAGRFKDAHTTLLDARQLDRESVSANLTITYGLEEKILYQFALDHEFGERIITAPMNTVVKYLALWNGRTIYEINTGTRRTGLDTLEDDCPGILQYLKEIVGKELWTKMENEHDLKLEISFPSIKN